jgi:Zn finger protein HypA/HybF involved in hydrogenase expression
MAKPECIICDEPSDDLDTEGICPDCHDDAAAETADELRAAGIDPEDPPVVIAAEIMRRTTD